MKPFKELREEIAAKSKRLTQVFEEAGPDRDFAKVKCLAASDTKAKVEEVQTMMKELDDLSGQIEVAKKLDAGAQRVAELHKAYNEPVLGLPFPGAPKAEAKSLGQMIMEHKADLVPNARPITIPFEFKTLMETTAGWAPESLRIPRVELYPLRALVVVDYIPQAPTTQAAIVYMLEDSPTLSAAEKAEAGAYAESAYTLTETTLTVRKITTSLPVTDEQLADVSAAEAYINNRLSYDIRRRLDLQVLQGDGNAPNLKGTTAIGGSLQTQAKGTDSTPDAIYKLFDKLRTVGFAEPSVLFINPSDWQPIRLLTTADGIYIFGSPLDAGRLSIWGVPVVQTTGVTANTAIAGDYTGFSMLFIRTGLEISVGYVNDDFTKGRKTLRADMRCCMVHFRTSAFGTITSI